MELVFPGSKKQKVGKVKVKVTSASALLSNETQAAVSATASSDARA